MLVNVRSANVISTIGPTPYERIEAPTQSLSVGDKLGSSANDPRPVGVLAKGKLKDGETYEGWPCRACDWFIAIDQSWPDAVRISDAHYVVAICPQCKTNRLGTLLLRQEFGAIRPSRS